MTTLSKFSEIAGQVDFTPMLVIFSAVIISILLIFQAYKLATGPGLAKSIRVFVHPNKLSGDYLYIDGPAAVVDGEFTNSKKLIANYSEFQTSAQLLINRLSKEKKLLLKPNLTIVLMPTQDTSITTEDYLQLGSLPIAVKTIEVLDGR